MDEIIYVNNYSNETNSFQTFCLVEILNWLLPIRFVIFSQILVIFHPFHCYQFSKCKKKKIPMSDINMFHNGYGLTRWRIEGEPQLLSPFLSLCLSRTKIIDKEWDHLWWMYYIDMKVIWRNLSRLCASTTKLDQRTAFFYLLSFHTNFIRNYSSNNFSLGSTTGHCFANLGSN